MFIAAQNYADQMVLECLEPAAWLATRQQQADDISQ
jgi:hypothetical protein